MNNVLRLLKPILPYLYLAEVALRNLDTNNEGADDKAADGVAEAIKTIMFFVSGETGVAQGLAAITAFGRSVLSSLDLLAGDTTIPHDEKVAKAHELANSLSDGTKVYQAQRGKDADALADFKVRAGRKVIEIENQI